MYIEYPNEVPTDGTDFFNLDNQFMLGPAVLVSPVLDPSSNTI
jgi:alpha-glucosidase (family GH31 glycosyl hydrolase)